MEDVVGVGDVEFKEYVNAHEYISTAVPLTDLKIVKCVCTENNVWRKTLLIRMKAQSITNPCDFCQLLTNRSILCGTIIC